MIYMFLSNNPSSGDINSSNLSCLLSDSAPIVLYMICAYCYYYKKATHAIQDQLEYYLYKKCIRFWKVHGIMNTSGPSQSKGFTLTLQGTPKYSRFHQPSEN